MTRLRRRLDDTGSLPVALLLIMVATMLSGLIASITTASIGSARYAMARPRLLDAAQSGLEVAVAHLRAAVDASGAGVLTALPCGPYSGTVGTGSGVGTRETYTVTITYKSVGGSVVPCTSGAGPAAVPRYADLVSTGADASTGAARTLTSRYTVGTTNSNIAGGRFRAWYTVGTIAKPCLDAGSATPAAGAVIYLAQCVPGSKQQIFAYTSRLQLALVSSATDAMPQGMCVDGGPLPHPSTPVVVTMQPCLSSGYARQQWNQNDANNLEGTSDGTNLDGHCLDKQFNQVPTPVVVRPACAFPFASDSSVGAGAAGASTQQLVNYGQFGKCLDVAEYNWQRYLFWLWQCKQAPTAAGVSWNQKWELPTIVPGSTGTSGYIISRPPALNGGPACLRSTLSNATTSYVTLVQCPQGTASGVLKWTVYGNTGVYATSYTIVDAAGNCLAPVPEGLPNSTVNNSGPDVSPAITVTCSGSTREKWNASPNDLLPGPLSLFDEK
jgi:hypothetical protein